MLWTLLRLVSFAFGGLITYALALNVIGGITTGKIAIRGGTLRRTKNPVAFWFVVSTQAVFGTFVPRGLWRCRS